MRTLEWIDPVTGEYYLEPFNTLKARARRKSMILTDDKVSCCYRLTAVDGCRFAPDLHELISDYSEPIPAFKREAKIDLAEEIDTHEVEVCDDPDCEWCGS